MRTVMGFVLCAVLFCLPAVVLAERQPLSDAELDGITAGINVIYNNPVPVILVNPHPVTQANGNVVCGGIACIFAPPPGPSQNVRILQTVPALPPGWVLKNNGKITLWGLQSLVP